MRKEVILAILIGAALGGVIAFGVWRANLSLNKSQDPNSPSTSITGNNEPSTEGLSVAEPEEGTISSKDKVMVKGKSKAGSIITVLAPKENLIFETKTDGTFETEVALESGVNEIKVSSFDSEGKETTQTLTVVYSTEFES